MTPNSDAGQQRPESAETDVDVIAETVDRDPLIVLLGSRTKAAALMALADAYPRALNPASITENAAIDRTSWYNIREDLLATGLVVEAGTAGNSTLYALPNHEEEPRTEWLMKLRDYTGKHLRENGYYESEAAKQEGGE